MPSGRAGQTRQTKPTAALVGLACAATLTLALPAHAKRGHVKYHPDAPSSPSGRYGSMTAAACFAELDHRAIAYTRVAEAPGVLAPVRLPKDVGGVVYRTDAPELERSKSPYEIFDCRLVLALSDFSKVLVAHDIDEVRMFSAWRPPPKGAHKNNKPDKRHPGALAIDVKRLGKKAAANKDKPWLDVEGEYGGRIGAVSCGPDATPPAPATSDAKELRGIVCEAADKHLFTSILTPNYDRPHHNHVHLEVTPDVGWFLVR